MIFERQIYETTFLNLNNSKNLAILKSDRKLQPIPLQPIPLQIFDTIPSTNQKLWELIDRGATTPIAAIALKQTAGRGQWNRTWQSAPGGLYLSVAISPDLTLDNSAVLVMATAWGIGTTLRSYQLPVWLKWQNDLILDRRKLGGIKIETRNQQQQITQAVIGVGINWTNPVPEVGINLQSYYQQQTENYKNYNYKNYISDISSLEQLTALTIYGILSGYQVYLDLGTETIRDRYQALLIDLGQQVTLNNSPGEVRGVTIDGKLKVRLRSPGATTEVHLSPGQISLGYKGRSLS